MVFQLRNIIICNNYQVIRIKSDIYSATTLLNITPSYINEVFLVCLQIQFTHAVYVVPRENKSAIAKLALVQYVV